MLQSVCPCQGDRSRQKITPLTVETVLQAGRSLLSQLLAWSLLGFTLTIAPPHPQ
ncbi:hypothetical protein H6F90_08190 [Trichocoleus sp. FACHB-591]|uniref:hypothetical protein n=1 Tax=Trichocoleus sp. FACHB-591 TaxID=2692872 RepID=UPI0016832E5B|nr:hypothetical protein [Trichocoleus sp. FACHB-591]MBD2095133.1 hypothetical protein [Trichocoleus sp. FACHB-591]